MLTLYSTIWRATWRAQAVLVLLSLCIAALAAAPLKFQKDIINGLAGSHMDSVHLLVLCAEMMGVILLSLGFKWLMGYRAGTLGEDVTCRLRHRIYGNHVEGDGREFGAGTIATTISAEAEELGRFTGTAFSEPVVQIGTLVSVIGFIASTQPGLGLIALAMIAPQIILVLATQPRINALVARRVRVLRDATNRIAAEDVREVSQQVLQEFDEIFGIRRRMFLWKLSTKFLLSATNGAGTVAVLALGGLLVLKGKTDVGTVVAATSGLARLQGPASFLIAFYRQVSATRVKFELIRDVADLAPRQTRPAAPDVRTP